VLEKVRHTRRYVYDFQAFTAEQHTKHGPSWTATLPGLPDALVTSDREVIKGLLTGDPLSRRHANDILARILGTESVLLLEPEPHLERRKALLPPFHGERISGYRDVMAGLVAADLDTWGDEVRVLDHSRALTLEVIQRIVLGSGDPGFAARLAALADTFNSPLANLGLFAPPLTRRARWNLPAEYFWRKVDQLDELMDGLVRSRAEEADSVLAMLRDTGLSDLALRDELKTLMIAGHETTATAIAWAADLLAHTPRVAEKLREGDAAYLAAAAKEVLRLRTVLPVSAARHMLPDGQMLLVDAHTLHHDPELWDEPEAFRPERFLEDEIQPYSYLPFGGGAHRCLGAALATLELEAAIAGITERFDLEPVGPPARPQRRGPTLVPANGAVVRARPRQAS
jgi:cytochrome P450